MDRDEVCQGQRTLHVPWTIVTASRLCLLSTHSQIGRVSNACSQKQKISKMPMTMNLTRYRLSRQHHVEAVRFTTRSSVTAQFTAHGHNLQDA